MQGARVLGSSGLGYLRGSRKTLYCLQTVNITFEANMANGYSVEDLLDFLAHASQRGLMPAATAQALAVASRNVFAVLDDAERVDLRAADLDAIIKRFANKRARDFNPSSLKEYGRRVQRAVDLFLQWRENPADFSVKTRTTNPGKKKDRNSRTEFLPTGTHDADSSDRTSFRSQGGYQSSFPIRPGKVVTISNVPEDLSAAEAERLAQFVKMLAID